MADARKYARTLSTCSLIAAFVTFVYWRIVFSHGPILKVDPRHCYGVVDAGAAYMTVGMVLWFGALVLTIGSVVLGVLGWKLLTTVKGVLALAVVFLNVGNLPSADSMLIPDQHAIATLRTINIAEVTYLSTVSRGVYGSITDLVRHDLLDSRFEGPSVQNYRFELTLASEGYLVVATPVGPNRPAQGCWEYYSTEDALIRFSKDPSKAPSGRAGTPIDQIKKRARSSPDRS